MASCTNASSAPPTPMIWPQQSETPNLNSEWLGDCHPLIDQVGAADGLTALESLSRALSAGPVRDAVALEAFLQSYHAQILIPIEMPAVESAYHYASRNAFRELVALDQEISRQQPL